MASVNKVILIGRVGKYPETKFVGNGEVTNFSLATSEYFTKDGERHERTEWHNIIIWNNMSKMYAPMIQKGALVYVEGKLKTDKWVDDTGVNKYKTSIVANTLRLLGSKPNNSGGYAHPQDQYNNSAGSDNVDTDDKKTFSYKTYGSNATSPTNPTPNTQTLLEEDIPY